VTTVLLFVLQVSHIECVSQGEAQEFVEDDQAHNWVKLYIVHTVEQSLVFGF